MNYYVRLSHIFTSSNCLDLVDHVLESHATFFYKCSGRNQQLFVNSEAVSMNHHVRLSRSGFTTSNRPELVDHVLENHAKPLQVFR